MAVIIDTNIVNKVFPKKGNTIYPILIRWLYRGKDGKIAVSKCLLIEQKNNNVLTHIAELKKAGRYIEVPEDVINREIRKPILSNCRSNDKCILAIMRVSGVRLVCTDDKSTLIPYLSANKGIITRPGGRRYNERDRRTAEDLLRKYGARGNNYKYLKQNKCV